MNTISLSKKRENFPVKVTTVLLLEKVWVQRVSQSYQASTASELLLATGAQSFIPVRRKDSCIRMSTL